MLLFSRGFRTQSLSRPNVTSSRSTLKVASRRIAAVCVALLCSAWVVLPASSAGRGTASSASLRPTLPTSYGKLPLSFEPNFGQTDGEVKFISRGAGYTLFLTPTEAVFSLQHSDARKSDGEATASVFDRAPRKPAQDAVLRVQLVGANPHAPIAGADALPGKTNYIRGNDPAKWITNIPGYASFTTAACFPEPIWSTTEITATSNMTSSSLPARIPLRSHSISAAPASFAWIARPAIWS